MHRVKLKTVIIGEEQVTFSKFVKRGYNNWLESKAAEAAKTADERISDIKCFGFNRVVPRTRDDMWDKLFDGGKDHNKEASIGKPEKMVALILMHIVFPGKLGEIDFLTGLSMLLLN